MSDLYKPDEAAKMLRMGRSTVLELVKARKLGCHRDGRKVRISRAQIAEYLARTEVRPAHDNRPRQPRRRADDIDVGAELERQFGKGVIT